MPFAWTRLSILGGTLVLMAGCGGSSGGGPGSGGSGGGGNPTTVTFTIAGGTPAAVATSIGSGSFTAATLASGKVTLSLPSGTTNFAVAFVCPPVSLTTIQSYSYVFENVFEASTLDGTSFSESCPSTPTIVGTSGATGTLTGSVDASAIAGVNLLNVYAQNPQTGSTFPNFAPLLGSSGNFSFAAPAGNDRVEVVAYNSDLIGPGESLKLVAAKNFSNQAVPGALNGGNTVVLGASDQTTLEPLTYQSVPTGYNAPSTLVGYEMSGGGSIVIGSGLTSEYPVVPAGASESGDYYLVTSTAVSAKEVGEHAAVSMTSSSAGPVSLTFPPAWPYAGPSPAALPSFNLSYTGFSGQNGVRAGIQTNWLTGSTTTNFIVVTPTGNYLNGSTTVVTPDFSSLTGFLAPPASGTAVNWSVDISQGNFPSLQQSPPNGTVKMVTNSGTYVVP